MEHHKTKIIELLSDRNISRIAISCHLSPDGDAIGSCIALALALQILGKHVDIIIPKFSKTFLPLIKNVKIISYTNAHYDMTFLLDCSDIYRTIDNIDKLSRTLVVIDHHNKEPFGNIYWMEPVAATAMLIYLLIADLIGKDKITSEIATALYMGIAGDTSCFSNYNVSSDALIYAGELIKYGADIDTIRNIFYMKTIAALRLEGRVLQNCVYDNKTRILYAVVLIEDIKKTGASYTEASNIINEMKKTSDADTFFLFIESSKDIKVRARSNGKIDVSKILEPYGGGGHSYAAGASIDSANIYGVADLIITSCKKQLENN